MGVVAGQAVAAGSRLRWGNRARRRRPVRRARAAPGAAPRPATSRVSAPERVCHLDRPRVQVQHAPGLQLEMPEGMHVVGGCTNPLMACDPRAGITSSAGACVPRCMIASDCSQAENKCDDEGRCCFSLDYAGCSNGVPCTNGAGLNSTRATSTTTGAAQDIDAEGVLMKGSKSPVFVSCGPSSSSSSSTVTAAQAEQLAEASSPSGARRHAGRDSMEARQVHLCLSAPGTPGGAPGPFAVSVKVTPFFGVSWYRPSSRRRSRDF